MTKFIVLPLLVLGIGIAVFVLQPKDSDSGQNMPAFFQQRGEAPEPEPTPFEFQELTIPFLREQIFESELSELERYSANANYTSYLTSYDSEGFQVNGLLTQPTGEMPVGGWPAIIFVHGYIPPTTYQTTKNYEAYVDYLARNGFAVFKIDLRGHGNSEGEASGAYYSGDYIYDTLNAYAALQRADFVNPDRIGLWGHSMAGNVVMRSVAAQQDIPAAVIWAGAVYTYEDMQAYGIDDNSYRPPSQQSERARERQRLNELHGSFNPESEFWKQVPPTNYLDGIQTAIQFNHAVDDGVVSIEYSRNVLPLLRNAGIKSEIEEYQSGGHNISGSAFTQAMQDTVTFFEQNL